MLHQGTDVVPVEFIAVKMPDHALAGHHDLLLANALAQAQALMQGKADDGGHRDFPGNRPSTFFLLDALTPASLGALLALHEHRVFVSGSIWGINSFDQWGVELGKVLALDIAPRLASGDTAGLDRLDGGAAAPMLPRGERRRRGYPRARLRTHIMRGQFSPTPEEREPWMTSRKPSRPASTSTWTSRAAPPGRNSGGFSCSRSW